MARDTATRIADRTRASQLYMKDKNFLTRAWGGMALATANTVDYLTGWTGSNTATFLGYTAQGLMRGAVYGALAALIPAMIFTAAPNLVFLGIVTLSAIGFAIHDSQKALDKRLYSEPTRLADRIAESLGAVQKTRNIFNTLSEASGVKWIATLFGVERKAAQQTPPNYKPVIRENKSPSDPPPKPIMQAEVHENAAPEVTEPENKFTAQEDARRAATQQADGPSL